MKSIFQAGGYLPPDSPVYIERRADQEMLGYLLDGKYIVLIKSRQTGKTSLIFRLRAQLANRNYTLAYVDVEGLDRHNEEAWYQALCAQLAPQLAGIIEGLPKPPPHYGKLKRFLKDLAERIAQRSWCLAIALDECGAIPQEWAEDFFKVLRDVYDSREVSPEFRNLTFILAGAFDPGDLIKDPRVSPFNVATWVDLKDFDPPQVRQLVEHLGVDEHAGHALAEFIYSWTSGHPYLTQKICSMLEEKGAPFVNEDVEEAANWIWRQDQHLAHIFRQLEAEAAVRDYLKTLVQGRVVQFNPTSDTRHRKLALIGVIKEDEHHNCVVRNRIYEEWLKAYFDKDGSPPPPPPPSTKLRIDPETGDVYRGSTCIPVEKFPPREYHLLQYLYKHCGKPRTLLQIWEAVWGLPGAPEPNTIQGVVSNLREIIEPDPKKPHYIVTVRAVGGYKLVECA